MDSNRDKKIQSDIPVLVAPRMLAHAGTEVLRLPEGENLTAIIAHVDPMLLANGRAIALVNDLVVPSDRWAECYPVTGDVVCISVAPMGGNAARTFATIGIMAVAIIGAAYGGPLLAGAFTAGQGASLWGVAVSTAVSVAGSLALNALMPPPGSGGDSSKDGSSWSISGPRNTIDQWGPVPVLYGESRIYPRYASNPYTELVGQDQYLRCLFVIGKGSYELSDMRIGETPIGNFAGVEIQQSYSGSSNYPNTIFPHTVNEDRDFSIALTDAGGWQTRSTITNTDEISIEISFPALYQIHNRGNHGSANVAFDIQYAPYGTTNWVNYYIAGSDVVSLTFSGTPSASIIKGQTIVDLTSGGTGTIQKAFYAQTEVVTGSEYLGEGMGWQDVYGMIDYCYGVRVSVTSGTFSAGHTVRAGGAYDAVVATANTTSVGVQGKHTTLFRYGITIPVERGQYTVRIRRTTADHEQDEIVDLSYWTALRSIRFENPVQLDGCCLLGMRIKASGQLNGPIDQFNLVARSFLPAHNGTGWHYIKTRNPAWAFCDILRGSSNKRAITDDSRLDLSAIRTWANNNAIDGCTFDGEMDSKGTVWDALKQVCFAGFASPGVARGTGKITVVEDRIKTTISQHFSPRNSWGFEWEKLFVTRPHALRCRFKNRNQFYEWDLRTVYDDGYSAVNATLFEDVDLPGITNPDLVWKIARRMIATARLRPEVFKINASPDYLTCSRGSLVRLNHDVIMVGLGAGRVKSLTLDVSNNVTTATFDTVFTMASGTAYGCRFRKSNGSSVTATVVTAAGDQSTLTFSPVIQAASAPAVGDLCLFGESGSESIECLVKHIQPGQDYSAQLTLVGYNPAIITSYAGAIPAYDPGTTLPPIDNRLPATPVIVATGYSLYNSDVNSDGTLDIGLTVVFEATTGFNRVTPNAPDVIQGFQAQYRIKDDGEWISLSPLDAYARQFFVVVLNQTIYEVRVRSFSLPGLYSGWDTEEVSVALAGTVPVNVDGLQVRGGGTVFEGKDCVIEWSSVTTGVMVKDYQVEVRTSDGLTLIRTEYVTNAFLEYTFDKNTVDGGPRPTLQFRVRARSSWGDLSAAYASLTVSNPGPTNPQGLGARSFMGGVEFYWEPALRTTIAIDSVEGHDGATLTGQDDEPISGGYPARVNTVESDFSHFAYRVRIGTGTWSEWVKTTLSGHYRVLSADEKETYGDAIIYFEVKAVDLFTQESASTAINEAVGSLNIKETDIDDFAITASKLFTKIPVIQGLTLTNNSPYSGYVAWSACTVCYNGASYSIASGSTNLKYIYWKDLATTFTGSATHPASISGWVPGEDFIIAVNISGNGQEAWNAIANQVIGSAYIMDLAVDDAKVSSLSGTKISATSSIAIGSATFGADGIQFEYNSGNPRFYAGDGSNNYIKFDGSNVLISTSGDDALTIKNGGDIKVEAGGIIKLMGGDGWVNGAINFIGSSYSSQLGMSASGDKVTFNEKTGLITLEIDFTNITFNGGAIDFENSASFTVGSTTDILISASDDIEIMAANVNAIGSTYSSSYKTYANFVASSSNSYLQLVTQKGGSQRTWVFTDIDFYPGDNNVLTCGKSNSAFSYVYAYNFSDVGDYYHLDSRDDISLLKQIKGSGQIDACTGLELIDDSTLPEILIQKSPNGEKVVNTKDGNKPYISHKALFSLLMGACRQLDARIDKLEKR